MLSSVDWTLAKWALADLGGTLHATKHMTARRKSAVDEIFDAQGAREQLPQLIQILPSLEI